ncbi:ATP-dependent DNA helicase [Lecanosticta acicola]|uniref:RecQ-like DNA helicase BLM n=1 Tax=Lecanosticta acicola TaxID=111012 RepID=A0AAI9EFQ4_9PEZI|nr:ATP-dependent DNA helicase [Lecanosticta acicola]
MTRNNLDEHLRWLLREKPSLPPDTISFPPVFASFPSASNSSFEEEEIQPLVSAKRRIPTLSVIADPSAGGEEMARTRAPPSATSRANTPQIAARSGSRAPVASPSKMPRQMPKPPSRPPASSSKDLTMQRTPVREQPSNIQANPVEFLDLTEDFSFSNSPTPEKKTTSNTGRKRKSEEFERGLRSAPVSAKKVALQNAIPFRPSQEFQDIEEWDSPTKQTDVPSEPPPPYSTMAPAKAKSPVRRPRPAPNKVSVRATPPVTLSSKREILDSDDEDDEDDDLVNFSGPCRKPPMVSPTRRSPVKLTPAAKQEEVETQYDEFPSIEEDEEVREPHGIVNYPNLDHAFATESKPAPRIEESFVKALPPTFTLATQRHATIEPPPTAGAQETSPETKELQDLLKNFFEASKEASHKVRQDIEKQREIIIEKIVDLFNQDIEDPQLTRQRSELEARDVALGELHSKATAYQDVTNDLATVSNNFKKALIAKESTDHIKTARAAARERLEDVQTRCISLLRRCEADVRAVVEYARKEAASKQRVAVESTQVPHNYLQDHKPQISSSSRIAQTQVPQRASPGPVSNSSTYAPQPKPPSHASRRQPIGDDSAMFDDNDFDDLEDSDMNAAANDLFSNRMGTPPMQYGYEEDDYGIDDGDDEMLLKTENEVRKPQTSARCQSKPPSAKSKKLSAKEEDELYRKNFSYPWSVDVGKVLKEKFRLKGFRENQVDAINATLGGKDTFVLMPTGGGKSLCYQLPALISSGKTRGVTIVISPLVSLMEDQVQHLRKLNIQAFLVNGETTRDERSHLMDGLEQDDVEKFVQLLYITPEMLSKSQAMMNSFERLYQRKRMARLVIDEAHCVSQWGHDFRPDYTAIGEVRRKFPGVPVMALTATATEAVKFDTIHNLGIKGCELFTRSFNRPNLYYEVRMKGKGKEGIENVANLIKEKHSKQTGIIYCLSRKNCEDLAKTLCEEYRIKAHHYHAGLETAEKSEVQKNWQEGRYHVIVATIAFGMGIDKANVRYVIHHSIPKSLEGYYQETGRAGRDGKPSSCYLFYGYQDAGKLRRMIDENKESSREQKDRQRQMLRKMTQYCDNQSDCRRVQVLRYFSEAFDQEDCMSGCDNCNSNSTFEDVDFTKYAKKAVSLVKELSHKKTTLLHCVDVFRGALTKKIKDLKQDKLDEFGAGQDIDRGDAERLFYRLLADDAIREENVLNGKGFAQQYVALGPRYHDFRSGRANLIMQVRTSPLSPRKPKTAPTKKTKKTKTATAAAPREVPMSTIISSPVQQAAAAKRKWPGHQTTLRELHANGYRRDDFVVSDPEDGDFQASDDNESDGSAPPRVATKTRKAKAAKTMAAPAMSSRVYERLDDLHQAIVDEFQAIAGKRVKEIMVKRNLTMAPFTNTMLRQMAIDFTDTEEKMLKIRGVDAEKVRLFGKHFTKLVGDIRARYEEMGGQVPGSDNEPEDQHAQNVIDLVTDDEDNDEYGSMAEETDDDGEGEESRFFQETAPEVAEFNARFAYSQSAGMRTMPASQPGRKSSPKHKRARTFKAKAHAAHGNGKAGTARKASGGAARSTSGGGIRKRSNGAKSTNNRGAASRQGGAYGSAISMMPT